MVLFQAFSHLGKLQLDLSKTYFKTVLLWWGIHWKKNCPKPVEGKKCILLYCIVFYCIV